MNQAQPYDRRAFFLSVIFVFIIIFLSGLMSVYLVSDKSINEVLVMVETASIIDENFMEHIDYERMIKAGRKGMFDQLDRYSGYVSNEGFELLNDNLSGGYTGFGISVQEHEKGLLILSVRLEGSASEAGILSGDIITMVDSISFEGLDGQVSIEHLRGEEGTKAAMVIHRPIDDISFEVEIERRRLEFMHIPFAGFTSDSLIYIRLLDFDPGASDDIKDAVDSLLKKTDNPRGILLDLRDNPGGLFREARAIADLFLESGQMMVGNDARSIWEDDNYYSTGEDITNGIPMAVLVNGNSASASEVVSGALQYSKRAFLVGDTTFGKGLVQGFVRYPDGDGLRLTISRYYFEGGHYLNDFDSALVDTGHGLVPDLHIDDDVPDFLKYNLDRSNLLRRFASIHQDEIIKQFNNNDLEDIWVAMLIDFINKQGDTLRSDRSLLAEELKLVAVDEEANDIVLSVIDKLINQSYQYDQNLLYLHKDYIKQQLAQIAVERNEGIYQSYKQTVINNQPAIKAAAEFLLSRNK